MLKPRFVIRVQTVNLRVEVWMNDIPVGFLSRNAGKAPVAIPVNQFLINGRNLIRVVLHAGPVPSRAGEPWSNDKEAIGYVGPASLSLNFTKETTEQASPSQNASPLVAVDWQGTADPRPSRLEREITLDDVVGPWAWETAVRFPLIDSELRAQVHEYLKLLYGLLTARQFDAFLSESATKLEELTVRAYGASAESLGRGMLQAFQVHSVAPYHLLPLELSEVDMRPVAGGRLIDCLRKNRRHVFEYVDPEEEDSFFLPTMIGKVGSQWRILR
jgi:hypothetical protein